MECLDTRGAGRLVKRSPAAIRNLVMRKEIPFRKVGGRLIFIREELEEWIRNCPGMSLDDLKAEK